MVQYNRSVASSSITGLLNQLSAGDRSVLDHLSPLVYDELHRLARSHMRRERAGHTLQPTALVHDAWLRLAAGGQPEYANRLHFFSVASRLMRQILVDHAREKQAAKRGGGVPPLRISDGLDFSEEKSGMVVALDDSLRELESKDPLKARLLDLRFFGGLTLEEAAEAEGLSMQAARRELRLAQAWLHRELAR